jgi:hypothetical protein
MTNEELDEIKDVVSELLSTEDIEVKKKYVCAFYQGGDNPYCRGCLQKEETVESCTEEYTGNILKRPQLVWSKDFTAKKKRDKVKIDSIGIGLSCDKCFLSDNCPLVEPGSLCGIDWGVEDLTDPKKALDYVIDIQAKRVNMGAVMEKVEGGTPDQILSGEMDRLARLVQQRQGLDMSRVSLTVEAQGKQSGGILASLFGGGQKQLSEEKHNTVEIPATDAEVVYEQPKKKDKTKRIQ